MNLPTMSQVVAFGRHVITFTAGGVTGGVTVAATMHVISAADATSATGAINQITSGLASVVAGVTTLVGIASGVWAAWKASPFQRLISVAADPQVKAVITEPTPEGKALANAAPANVTAAK